MIGYRADTNCIYVVKKLKLKAHVTHNIVYFYTYYNPSFTITCNVAFYLNLSTMSLVSKLLFGLDCTDQKE